MTAYFLLLVTAALWGIAAPIVKYTLTFIDPISFLFYRFILVSLLFSVPFLMAIRKKPLSLRQLIKLGGIGAIGGPITLLLIFFGADRTSSLNASLIIAMAPVLVVLSGAWFLKEKVTKRERLGLTIALGGTVLTVIQPLIAGNGFARSHLWGNLLLLIHNFVWTTYCILIKKQSDKHSPLVLTAITFFSGVVILTPLFLNQKALYNPQRFPYQAPEPPLRVATPDPKAIPGILYMSIFSSVIAYTTHNWGMSLIEASEGTIFTYLQPVFAAPLAFFWLDEKMSLPFWLGAGLIGLGVFLAESRSEIIKGKS